MKNLHSINKEQGLFTFKNGNYYSCLGFEVVLNRVKKLSKELNIKVPNHRKGSIASLKTYNKLTKIVHNLHQKTGFRSKSELVPQFIGHEGKRVEIVWTYGEKSRCYIGKSTGFIPCHIEVKRSDSTGGGSISPDSIKSFRFI